MMLYQKALPHWALLPALSHSQVPEHRNAVRLTLGCEDQKSAEAAMRDVAVAPKLLALKDLLAQCGVTSDGAEEETGVHFYGMGVDCLG